MRGERPATVAIELLDCLAEFGDLDREPLDEVSLVIRHFAHSLFFLSVSSSVGEEIAAW